jgi:hypothetical protein
LLIIASLYPKPTMNSRVSEGFKSLAAFTDAKAFLFRCNPFARMAEPYRSSVSMRVVVPKSEQNRFRVVLHG